MISGIVARVSLRERTARDGFGNAVESYSEPIDVPNVLVQPGACADLDSTRPEGVRVSLTLHFPRGFAERLRGAKVALPAPWKGEYSVVGDPMPYAESLCPGPWSMPVEVVACDG